MQYLTPSPSSVHKSSLGVDGPLKKPKEKPQPRPPWKPKEKPQPRPPWKPKEKPQPRPPWKPKEKPQPRPPWKQKEKPQPRPHENWQRNGRSCGHPPPPFSPPPASCPAWSPPAPSAWPAPSCAPPAPGASWPPRCPSSPRSPCPTSGPETQEGSVRKSCRSAHRQCRCKDFTGRWLHIVQGYSGSLAIGNLLVLTFRADSYFRICCTTLDHVRGRSWHQLKTYKPKVNSLHWRLSNLTPNVQTPA